MSRFSRPVRLPFQHGGYMVANRPGPINGIAYQQGDVIPPEALASVNGRKLQTLWEAKRLEMASTEQIEQYLTDGNGVTIDADTPPAIFGTNLYPSGMVTMGDGSEIQLGTVVLRAFQVFGGDEEAWNALDDADRDARIQKVALEWSEELVAAKVREDAAGKLKDAKGKAVNPPAGKITDPPSEIAGPRAPKGELAAWHKGFGRWFIIDDAGKQIAGPMPKEQALARAPELKKD